MTTRGPQPQTQPPSPGPAAGIALIAVLLALTLLLLLALPFSLGMSFGYEAAVQGTQVTRAEQDSASVRDLLLGDAGLGHPLVDPTPTADGLDEFPDRPQLPGAFAGLLDEGSVLLGGSVEDLQRRIDLASVTPLLLANLLGTSCRLAEPLAKDSTVLTVDDGARLPEQGYVLVDLELIHYGRRQGNVLEDLQRGLLAADNAFATEEHEVRKGALVLDYRCVIAAAWPFERPGSPAKDQLRPFASIGELAEIQGAGFGGFTAEEMDVFERTLTVGGGHRTAPTWGRPLRVYNDLDPSPEVRTRALRVQSSLHVGPGAVVRLRQLNGPQVEYGLVLQSSTPRRGAQVALQLPSEFLLVLHTPVAHAFAAVDTVVEPLVPVPVNVNTASAEVLRALLLSLQLGYAVRVHDGVGLTSELPPPIGRSDARALCDKLLALRSSGDGALAGGPFTGWQDLVERWLKPELQAADSRERKRLLLYVYGNLLYGRLAELDMGTLPVCFTSGPWVRYRAAAMVLPSAGARGVAARMERQGLAVATPGLPLEDSWETQDLLEEAFRLDQRSPGWTTSPVNVGAVLENDLGNDPASRVLAHATTFAFPDIGLGETRFPSRERTDVGIRPAPATTPAGAWMNPQLEQVQHEGFATALDPRGRDLRREGSYLMPNSGPRPGSAPAPAAGGDHQKRFPFSVGGGFCNRLGSSFWLEPDSWGATQTLFDYSDGDQERNRLSVRIADGNLQLEVLDEAGLDPNPSLSPTQVQRSAGLWSVPLAELQLGARTPLHVNFAAYGSRPGQLSLLLDGFPRGKARYRTFLTASLPVYDPAAQGFSLPGQDGARYLDVAVDSTDGFPPQGVLRIGLELFEYTVINGNSFRCTFADSTGGRLARQTAREFRPDIPLDSNGRPTIDYDSQQMLQQGVLDVAPEHPVGSAVELYGYSVLPYPDIPLQIGETALVDAMGAFAVARGYVRNGRPITITVQGRPPVNVGTGLDQNATNDIELFDPTPNKRPEQGSQSPDVAAAFAPSGGYALLLQSRRYLDYTAVPGSTSAYVGGVEVIQYSGRQGNKLTGITRNVQLPGDNSRIQNWIYDGTARQFVSDWDDRMTIGRVSPPVTFDEAPLLMLWVVPISLPMQSPIPLLSDPAVTGTTEFLQLYPKDTEVDTEFVSYDLIRDQRHVMRSNRFRWARLFFALTQQSRETTIDLGPLGPTNSDTSWLNAPWGQLTPSSGYIGYTPQLEASWPQIQAARDALQFRGTCDTSSHPQPNSQVLPCHRLQITWGNYGALHGRIGRQDRVALISGAQNGDQRPNVEWHTVNWVWKRFGSDLLQEDRTPPELFGPYPFQLVGFKARLESVVVGPPSNNAARDVRAFDRLVKFPSGELPAAYCAEVAYGAGVGNREPVTGILDEVHVTAQLAKDLVVEEAFAADAKTFRVRSDAELLPQGLDFVGGDLAAGFARGGGLLQVDAEVIAYQGVADGVFTLAVNGRGLLGTEPRGHDRGAAVEFLTHVPAAILNAALGAQADSVAVQALGALASRNGALLCGREVLHYCWTRQLGDQVTLEMPRHRPDGDDGTGGRGLLRGRFGTAPQALGSGEAVIQFPIRYWDRQVERSEDPELHYFQFSSLQAPVFWKSLSWREETSDGSVDVDCLVRLDGRPSFAADPQATPGLWRFSRAAGDDGGRRLGRMASLCELRFAAVYRPGCLDLQSHLAHGYKTTVTVRDVRVEYEGEPRIVDERVTAR